MTHSSPLGNGYTAVPYSQVCANGHYLANLPVEGTALAVIGPDRRTLMDETGRPYRYASLDEAKQDVATLIAPAV